jgi:hypothetical protein
MYCGMPRTPAPTVLAFLESTGVLFPLANFSRRGSAASRQHVAHRRPIRRGHRAVPARTGAAFRRRSQGLFSVPACSRISPLFSATGVEADTTENREQNHAAFGKTIG